jgi:hypothetical protein
MHYVLIFLLMIVIVGAGWNEPLKYRFMSADKILALEQERAAAFVPQQQQPKEKSGAWMWDRDYRTALERNTIVGMPQVEIREPNITTRWIKSDAGESR